MFMFVCLRDAQNEAMETRKGTLINVIIRTIYENFSQTRSNTLQTPK